MKINWFMVLVEASRHNIVEEFQNKIVSGSEGIFGNALGRKKNPNYLYYNRNSTKKVFSFHDEIDLLIDQFSKFYFDIEKFNGKETLKAICEFYSKSALKEQRNPSFINGTGYRKLCIKLLKELESESRSLKTPESLFTSKCSLLACGVLELVCASRGEDWDPLGSAIQEALFSLVFLNRHLKLNIDEIIFNVFLNFVRVESLCNEYFSCINNKVTNPNAKKMFFKNLRELIMEMHSVMTKYHNSYSPGMVFTPEIIWHINNTSRNFFLFRFYLDLLETFNYYIKEGPRESPAIYSISKFLTTLGRASFIPVFQNIKGESKAPSSESLSSPLSFETVDLSSFKKYFESSILDSVSLLTEGNSTKEMISLERLASIFQALYSSAPVYLNLTSAIDAFVKLSLKNDNYLVLNQNYIFSQNLIDFIAKSMEEEPGYEINKFEKDDLAKLEAASSLIENGKLKHDISNLITNNLPSSDSSSRHYNRYTYVLMVSVGLLVILFLYSCHRIFKIM